MVFLALAAVATACDQDDRPDEMVPAREQQDLPLKPPGGAISRLCGAGGGFSRQATEAFRRQGQREFAALKRVYLRYPNHGVTVATDTEDNPRFEKHVWTIEELVDRELDSIVGAAEDIDDLPASANMSACEKRYVRELQRIRQSR